MAQTGVSHDGKYYAAISNDGRLKIWDTETSILKQQYTPDLHLSASPICLQWILASSAAVSIPHVVLPLTKEVAPVKRKSTDPESEVQYIVLGTKNGKLLIYNVLKAKLDSVLETKFHNGVPVTALNWSRKYGLFSVNKQNVLYEWDIGKRRFKHKYDLKEKRGKKEFFTTSIAIIPQNIDSASKYIATSSYRMYLWHLTGTTSTLLRTLGHGLAVEIIAMPFGNQCYLLRSSKDERLLSVWDVTITEEMVAMAKKKNYVMDSETSPLYNFLLEDAPKEVDVLIEDGTSPKLNLCAVTRSGVVHYYGLPVNGGSSRPMKPTLTLHITSDDANPLLITTCKYRKPDSDGSGAEALIAYETANRTLFEFIKLDPSSRTQVLIRSAENSKKSNKSRTEESNRIEVVAGSSNIAYVESAEAVPRKRSAPGTSLEVPMEERLSNLAMDVEDRSKSAINQNLTKLLIQGLHSKDKSIILLVLQKDEPSVARRTLSNLPANYIGLLLEQLSEMATRKTSQCASVCTWLSALVQCHSSLMLATLNNDATHANLAKLLATLTQRRSHLCQLLNLKGRLELTMSQRAKVNNLDETPVLEYQDTATDNEEMEAEVLSSGEELEENYFEESDAESDQNGSDGDDTVTDEDMS